MANNIPITKVKKGDTVLLCLFTGCKAGVKEVIACDKSTVILRTNLGEVTFDRKTGKQIEPMPKNPRYASFITVDDGSYVPPQRKKKAKPVEDPKPVEKPEEDDWDDDDFEEVE